MGQKEQVAYDKLKEALCNATESRLAIIDMNKPFHLLVDSSDHTASGVLTHLMMLGLNNLLPSPVKA